MQNSRLSLHIREQLRCPVCAATLSSVEEHLVCTRVECERRYPIVDGVPVILNQYRSIFSENDFRSRRDTTFRRQQSKLETVFSRLLDLLPSISTSMGSERNYGHLSDALLKQTPAPKVLVVGGSILGAGMKALAHPSIELVGTDVAFGPLTTLICDAHDIPFENDTFHGVVAQAVLEHVVDPYRCVAEVHRVLKPGGLVYAETPFMQQVHMGRYDFTRFTHSGHRRLFRDFDEIRSGPVGGPGTALAWSYLYFLLSFASSRPARGLIRAFAQVTSFYFKYFDYFLRQKSTVFDAASGYYFMGCKAGRTLSDRELIAYYKGAASN